MGVLSGVVRTGDGQPIAGAKVMIESGPGRFPDIACLTDEMGRFSIGVHEPGAYSVACFAEGFGPARADLVVAEGEATLVLEMRPGGATP